MGYVVTEHSGARSLSDRKQVEARVRFTGVYDASGVPLKPGDFGLSELTDIDDAIAEGFVLRWGRTTAPYRLKIFGKDPDTLNQTELSGGFDISALDDVRLRVWGW